MATMSFSYLIICAMLCATIGSESETSSVSSIQDSIRTLKEMVVLLQDKMSAKESSLLHKIEVGNEDILNKMGSHSETCASTNSVSEMDDALRKELRALLSNQEKLNQQLEDVQSNCFGEPPSPRNGRPMAFERKHGSDVNYQCDWNFFVAENSTVRCDFGKWEGRPPTCKSFDEAFTLRVRYDGNDNVSNVTCASEESPLEMHFSRLLDTGTGGTLPKGTKTYWTSKGAVLDFSSVGLEHRRGVFHCGYQRVGRRRRISFLVNPDGSFPRPLVVNYGEPEQVGFRSSESGDWAWLHDGVLYPSGYGYEALFMGSVGKGNAGVYERYSQEDRPGTQGFSKLVVRGCRANLFGESCDKVCPPCYNGGTCHELQGTCLCAAGFQGSNCEIACGENRVGPNCSESCEGGDCSRQLFCKPDPYGCSCASGYRGHFCELKCGDGSFGADCKQRCHCASGPCDPYTGACSEGCAPGWTGQSCQIPA